MNNKKLIIEKSTGRKTGVVALCYEFEWNTMADIIKIISNKDLGINFTIPSYLKYPDYCAGLKHRYEGLAYEIFNEEKTDFKEFKFEVQFFYNGEKMSRTKYYNSCVEARKTNNNISSFDKYVIAHNNFKKVTEALN